MALKVTNESIPQASSAVVVKKDQLLKAKFKQRNSVPSGKRTVAKRTRYVVWTTILVLGLSGVLAFVKANNVSNSNAQLIEKVDAMTKNLETLTAISVDERKMDAYFAEFIPIFMNLDSEDYDARVEREVALGHYFESTSDYTFGNDSNRRLEEFRLYELAQVEGGFVARYFIRYMTNEIEGEKTQIFEHLLNIPFVEENGVFAITEFPYFGLVPENRGVVATIESALSERNQVSFAEVEGLEEFLEQFFNNYASSSVEDIAYMMQEPISLNGQFEYLRSENKVYEFENQEELIVQSVIELQLINTELAHKEHMTLTISNDGDRFFVENLSHTLGGMD
jgi:MFS superfamily sulfate permease-like transporter